MYHLVGGAEVEALGLEDGGIQLCRDWKVGMTIKEGMPGGGSRRSEPGGANPGTRAAQSFHLADKWEARKQAYEAGGEVSG